MVILLPKAETNLRYCSGQGLPGVSLCPPPSLNVGARKMGADQHVGVISHVRIGSDIMMLYSTALKFLECHGITSCLKA